MDTRKDVTDAIRSLTAAHRGAHIPAQPYPAVTQSSYLHFVGDSASIDQISTPGLPSVLNLGVIMLIHQPFPIPLCKMIDCYK